MQVICIDTIGARFLVLGAVYTVAFEVKCSCAKGIKHYGLAEAPRKRAPREHMVCHWCRKPAPFVFNYHIAVARRFIPKPDPDMLVKERELETT